MKEPTQAALLGIYRAVLATGVLHTSWGYRAFERVYDFYKAAAESSFLDHVRGFVPPGSAVVDLGAHVGFFTERFATWTRATGGQVIAVEPEPINFGRLQHRIARRGLTHVKAFNLAVAETPGDLFLKVDPFHPGDHQLAAEGLGVRGTSLDALMGECGWPRVGLVKLDIQGAEMRALSGGRETLARFKPVLLVEIDDERLRRQGSSGAELLALLDDLGYGAHHLTRQGLSRVLATADARHIVDRAAGSYVDFLFVPEARA